jgi:hypothetical protein
MSSTNTGNVSIRLTSSTDERGEYNAFTAVSVDILFRAKKIGSIAATVVNRQRIPKHAFMSAYDGHSGDMQWVGVALFEPKYGRTKLQSLVQYDDPEFDFVYIESFHIDDEYKRNGASDVGAAALRLFLFHPVIKGNLDHGLWMNSCAV